MLKRFLLCKFSGGRGRLSAASSNFPFGNRREGLNSRCQERVDTSITSSFEGILDIGSSRKLHVGIAFPNQLLEFPRHEVDSVENQKTSSNTEKNDNFAELGSSVLEGTGSGYNLTTEDVVEDLKMSRNSTIEGVDDFAGFCLSVIKGAGSEFNPTTEKREEYENYSIPTDLSPQELKENLLNYGEILCASMRAGKGGLARCLVKFKRMKSKRMAIAARWVTLKNYQLQIHSSCLEFLTIRITNVSTATGKGFIHLTCRKYGDVSGLVRTEDGAVDVSASNQGWSTFSFPFLSFCPNILKSK